MYFYETWWKEQRWGKSLFKLLTFHIIYSLHTYKLSVWSSLFPPPTSRLHRDAVWPSGRGHLHPGLQLSHVRPPSLRHRPVELWQQVGLRMSRRLFFTRTHPPSAACPQISSRGRGGVAPAAPPWSHTDEKRKTVMRLKRKTFVPGVGESDNSPGSCFWVFFVCSMISFYPLCTVSVYKYTCVQSEREKHTRLLSVLETGALVRHSNNRPCLRTCVLILSFLSCPRVWRHLLAKSYICH